MPAGGSDVDGTLIISKGDGANKLHKLAFAAGMKKARLCSAHSHRPPHFSPPPVFLSRPGGIHRTNQAPPPLQ